MYYVKVLYKLFGEMRKHILTGHFGRPQIYVWKKKIKEIIQPNVW